MKKHHQNNPPELSRVKKFVYNSILIIFIPCIILFLSEMLLRIVGYGDNYKLFLDFPAEDYQEYKFLNPDIGKKYFQKLDYNKPCSDMFLREKPENGFRLFVLGSSTALGFPYEQNMIFSRILQERLQDCYPEKKIEIVNTAITAINSFTLIDFVDDVLKEEPDAVLIYAGHNEFYGALGVGSIEKTLRSRKMTHLHLNLLSLKIYQALRNLINRAEVRLAGDNPEISTRGTLMKRIVSNKEIAYKGSTYNTGMQYYRENMDELLHKIRKKNIPVFISEICSNVKDIEPFCSVKTEAYPPASSVFSNARKSEDTGNYIEAKELYNYAKDLDCIRFRASEEINEIIHEVALKNNAHLVRMKTDYFEAVSPNSIIGENLMTEHVHPNIDGYFLMADAFFNDITSSGILEGELDPVLYKNSAYYQKNWGYTELDSLVASHGVNILKTNWPFQSLESTSNEYRQNYKPQSFVDSLAFRVVTSANITIEDGHNILAEYYLKNGDYYKAFKEFYANVKYDPFQVLHYNNAIHCLTFTNDFSLAFKLADKSLELKETFYANYIKGEILFLQGDYSSAIKALHKSAEFDNSVEVKLQILNSLHELYTYSGNQKKADEVLKEIRKVNPDFKPEYPIERKNYVFYIPVQVEEQVNKAYSFYRERNFDQALGLFLNSLTIKETSLANRCVGDILFTRNDSSAIIYYQRAYPDYQNNINFLFNLGILYVQYKQAEDAKRMLEEIKDLNPNFEKIPLLEQEIKALSS
jgi:tetratricopeptide (TPR) repeat protein/lysophospholipase L1-like esterase